MKPSILAAILAATFFLAPTAYAETGAIPIGNPYTDTLQLWGSIASSVEFIAQDAMSAAGQLSSAMLQLAWTVAAPHSQQTTTRPLAPPQVFAATTQSALIAAVASFESASSAAATSSETTLDATSYPTTNSQLGNSAELISPGASDPAPAFNAGAFVTQDELIADLSELSNALTAKFSAPATTILPQSVAADGNGENPFAATNAINSLSDVTISNSMIDSASIPDLSGKYLSLNGGTLTGALFNTSTSSSYFLGSLGLGTTSPASTLAVSGGASIGADYNTAAPSNGLIVEGSVGIGTITPTDPPDSTAVNYLLNLVSNSKGPVLRVAVENPTTSISPQIDIDSYENGGVGQSAQIAMRNWPGTISSPSGSIPSGTLLGGLQWEGPFTTDGTSWGSYAAIKATTDEASSPNNDGTHMSFFTTALGGSTAGISDQERMRIAPNGIGIRTTSPAFQLDVKGFGRISTTTFTGVGLNDTTAGGTYTGTDTSTDTYTVIIQTNGTPDTFEWQKNSGSFTTGVAITGSSQTLTDGVTIKFAATTGHTVGDQWVITATPVSPFGVQNDAGTRSLVVQNNGDVGIGNTSPASILSLAGNYTGTAWTTTGADLSIANNTLTDNSSSANSTIATRSANSFGTPTFAFSTATSTITNAATLYISGAPTAQASSTIITHALALDVNAGISYFGGNVGIGTSTPSGRLTVWGTDAASSTLAFNVVSSASSTVFAVFDGGNAELSGTLSQSSDQRLKTNIQSLDASSSLAAIEQLNPVTFNWIDPEKGAEPQLGFIAQQVQDVFPYLVSTTSATALTPDGTLSLNYIGLISPIVAAIQELSTEITSIENTITSFAQSITSAVGNFGQLNAQNELCVGSTCVTPAQFQAMVAAAGQAASAPIASDDASSNMQAADTPPVIQINGDNPAIVQIGATYNDLGAAITGPEQDLDLGTKTYLNGTLTSNIVVDTSQAATDTIDYVATDQTGLTSTSTRTVLIEAPSIVPTATASSTDDSGVGDSTSSTTSTSTTSD